MFDFKNDRWQGLQACAIAIFLTFPTLAWTDTDSLRVPIPCSQALEKFADELDLGSGLKTKIKSCHKVFGECNVLTTGTELEKIYSGIRTDIVDRLIANVVGVRIKNLYKGINSSKEVSRTSPLNFKGQLWKRDKKIRLNNQTILLSKAIDDQKDGITCADSGACNMYCGEGAHFDGSTITPFARMDMPMRPDLASQASYNDRGGGTIFVKDGMDSLNNAQILNSSDKSNIAEPDSPADFPKPEHFSVKTTYAPFLKRTREIDPTNVDAGNDTKITPWGSKEDMADPRGWPIQALDHDVDQDLEICASIDGDQTHLASDANDHGATHAKISTIAWDDGTFALPGSSGHCNMFYIPDFKTASTISALQVGVLAQLNWIALDAMVRKIHPQLNKASENEDVKDPVGLTLKHPLCIEAGQEYLNNLKKTIDALSPGACDRSLAEIKSNSLAKIKDDKIVAIQSDTHLASLISVMQASGFEKLAECEVYHEANERFEELFFDTGRAFFNQLKNWAIAGCIRALGSPFSEEYQYVDTLREYVRHAAGLYNTNFKACFPYAFEAALFAYLNSGVTSERLIYVGLQKKYTSDKTADLEDDETAGSNSRLQIDKCDLIRNKIMDRAKPAEQTSNKQRPDLPFASPESFLAGLGLIFTGKNRKKNRTKLLGLQLAILFSTAFLSAEVCLANAKKVRIISFVNNYCIGHNGVLITGEDIEKCCEFDSAYGLSKQVTVDTLGYHVPKLRGRPKYDVKSIVGAPAKEDPACPGVLDEVYADIAEQNAGAEEVISSMVGAIGALKSTNENKAINPDAEGEVIKPYDAQTGVSNDWYANVAPATAGGSANSNDPATRANAKENSGFFNSLAKSLGFGGSPTGTSAGNGTGGPGAVGADGRTVAAATAGGKAGAPAEKPSDGSPSSGYSSGGAGGMGSGGGYGGSDVSIDPSKLGLGGKGGPDGKKPVGETVDPVDYFSRLKPTDNLFKVIERKYREKTPELTS